MPLYAAAAVRELEASLANRSPQPLMQLAGEAAARMALRLAGEGATFVCVAGPGNNGGDAVVAAECLRAGGWQVWLVLPWQDRLHRLEAPAQRAFAAYSAAAGTVLTHWPRAVPPGAVVLDGVLGIGCNRASDGVALALIENINAARAAGATVLALDLPSGLDGDTGHASGAFVKATHTVTFLAAKPGLFTGIGPDCAGNVVTEPLSARPQPLSAALLQSVATPPSAAMANGRTGELLAVGADAPARAVLMTETDLPLLRPPRRSATAHKGSQGTLVVLGGADGMAGAPILAGRAALTLGAGKVRVEFVGVAPLYDSAMPELMLGPAIAGWADASAVIIGPGMGQEEGAASLLASALASDLPLVLDADALNLIASVEPLQNAVHARRAATIVTPHPLEAARLLGVPTRAVQKDRIGVALEMAARYNAIVVLKGAGTVIASATRLPHVNGSGNAALATAGAGDVLAGMIGAMLARGVAPFNAACLGVVLHGAAADAYVAKSGGQEGLTASAIAPLAAAALNRCSA